MPDFSPEDKKLITMGQQSYFPYGVHKVKLLDFQNVEPADGKPYIEVFFESEDGTYSESVRRYTSEKAKNWTFNILRAIYMLHVPEKFKAEAEKTIDGVSGTQALVDLLNKKVLGKHAWIEKHPSDTRTLQNGKPAPETNLFSHEPKSQLVKDAESVFNTPVNADTDSPPVEDATDAWSND